jgi:hypothetical protein
VPTLPEIEVKLHALLLPDFERAARICGYRAKPRTLDFGKLLVDCEEDCIVWVG